MAAKIYFSEKGRERSLNAMAIFIGICFLFPIYWLIATSLKTEAEIFQSPPTLFPTVLHFENYNGSRHQQNH